MKVNPRWPVVLALLFGMAGGLRAQTIIYDRTTFLADPKVVAPADLTFDLLAPGTDLDGQTITGVTFNSPGVAPLEVILAASGVRNALSASSGLNVLSPGGSNTALEDDDLELVFANPVQAAGLDVVLDVPDGASFVSVTFYDVAGSILAQNNSIPAPNGAPGYQFVGLVTGNNGPFIKKIVIDEYDPTANDDHVAFDSLVFAAVPVPEPSALLLLPAGLLLLGIARARRR